MEIYQIAIDGPSGSGKSTLAKSAALALNISYLDTGAMYRACAYWALQRKLDIKNSAGMDRHMEKLDLQVQFLGEEQRVLVDKIDVTDLIRTPQISKAASDISAIPSVRRKLVSLQQQIAEAKSFVLDGRDIGTIVLPSAKYKFFLIAELEERGRRRLLQLQEQGIDNCSLEQVIEDIRQRDFNDSTRDHSPLMQASDAVLIDTTSNTSEQTLAVLLGFITPSLG